MEQTDWHEQEDDRFLRKLADRLDAAVNARLVKSLILIDPPRPLRVHHQK
jgi:protein required for attachment to host cells